MRQASAEATRRWHESHKLTLRTYILPMLGATLKDRMPGKSRVSAMFLCGMPAGQTASGEEARLAALHQLNLLDTPPSESFDRVTRMAAKIFDLPIAAVSLTDRDRQWFKSRIGVDHSSIPREKAPCGEVTDTGDLLIIPDLAADACYASSLLGQNGIRFYAGAPLTTRDGYVLGALCVLGTEARAVAADEVDALCDLAAMVMSQIELQHAFGRVDPLSGLPNRSQLMEDLGDLALDKAGTARFAVMVDLGQSHDIESISRIIGSTPIDQLVRDAAGILRTILGQDCNIYHVATTKFVFLSPPDVGEAAYLDFLSAALQATRKGENSAIGITTAFGVVPLVHGKTDCTDMLRALNSAAYEAHFTASSISVYSDAMDEIHRRRFRLLRDFEDALQAGDQLRIVYQPRVGLSDRICEGAEALLRWRHPQFGDVPPGEFIPIVERSCFGKALTTFVLVSALKQLRAWKQAGLNLQLSVNVSACNLSEEDFAGEVASALAEHQVTAEALELEVTESAVMRDTRIALKHLHALSRMGISLAIDDFGTGYSSLAYLQQLPAQIVKIDQAFIRNLGKGERERTLVRSMISLSHDLGYRVVAEGVETGPEADVLQDMGCDEAQGYFFARPLEVEAFERWLATHRRPASGCGAADQTINE